DAGFRRLGQHADGFGINWINGANQSRRSARANSRTFRAADNNGLGRLHEPADDTGLQPIAELSVANPANWRPLGRKDGDATGSELAEPARFAGYTPRPRVVASIPS